MSTVMELELIEPVLHLAHEPAAAARMADALLQRAPVRPSHVPKGFHSVTPFLRGDDAERLVTFVLATFEARGEPRTTQPDGSIGHAQLVVEGSMVEVSEARSEWPSLTAALPVFVPDVDATYRKALAAGATSLMAPEDMPWVRREAAVRDAPGTRW